VSWGEREMAACSRSRLTFSFSIRRVIANYEKVAQAVYKYIHLLKSQPPSEEAFNEIKALAEIGFRFVERGGASSYVSDLARQLHQPVPREKIISSQWLVEEFDAEEIRRSLDLLDPRRSNIAVSARKLPRVSRGRSISPNRSTRPNINGSR
jgi:insulysin